MSNTKTVMSQAANTQGIPLDITDVFSTYLYEGDDTNPSAKVNGIDLSGEGGMVWLKSRTGATNNYIADTEQPLSSGGGATWLYTNTTDAAIGSVGTGLLGFNSDGFSTFATGTGVNNSSHDYASWTFRKAPKFFDVVTYTGNGVAGREIAHNLGSEVGMVVVKKTNNQGGWHAWHRSSPTGSLRLDTTAEAYPSSTTRFYFGDTVNVIAPTDSVFTVSNNGEVNGNGDTYVAYLFAHNDGDGEFGPDGDQDIIKCGSFTGTGSSSPVDLGWEPQFLLWKQTNAADDWYISDNMRGLHPQDINAVTLRPNQSAAENASGRPGITSTGFEFIGGSGDTYIYMAIRRGPLAPPESGTEVFDVDAQNGGSFVNTPFPVDFQINKNRTFASGAVAISRLTGGRALDTSSTGAEGGASYFEFDHQNGIEDNYQGIDGCIYWSFKRAPNFFDVVAYTGTGSPLTLSHNLGVSPELILYKSRSASQYWFVQSSALTSVTDSYVFVNYDNAESSAIGTIWRTPDETTFGIDYTGNLTGCNTAGVTYIAYLFATLAGVSKVGSYTGNGSSQTIDCGFTSGARLVLIKSTSTTGDWLIADTERGIVAGSDPYLELNTTNAEVTSEDWLDPDSSGFIVNEVSGSNANTSGVSYIFYAIA